MIRYYSVTQIMDAMKGVPTKEENKNENKKKLKCWKKTRCATYLELH